MSSPKRLKVATGVAAAAPGLGHALAAAESVAGGGDVGTSRKSPIDTPPPQAVAGSRRPDVQMELRMFPVL